MRFSPLSEKQADEMAANIWPDGNYDFEVKSAIEKVSAAGNGMFALELWIFNSDGDRRMVFDYLVDSEKAKWKMRHFADATGLTREYESGSLNEQDMEGRTGKCTLGTQPAKDGYQAKNVVRGYVKAAGATVLNRAPARASVGGGDLDDSIPFAPCWQ